MISSGGWDNTGGSPPDVLTAGPILGVTTILPFVVGESGPELIDKFIPDYGPVATACCDYCGNRSALRDRRGNCPACGAPR
jgi:hypothetical protein